MSVNFYVASIISMICAHSGKGSRRCDRAHCIGSLFIPFALLPDCSCLLASVRRFALNVELQIFLRSLYRESELVILTTHFKAVFTKQWAGNSG